MRVRAKICGLTRPEDVTLAAKLGADAVGFVFAAGKRTVTPLQARDLAAAVPAYVNRVGVFTPDQRADAPAIAEACRLDTIQLHGAGPADAAWAAYHRGRFAIVLGVAVVPGDTLPLSALIAGLAPHCDAILLDTPGGGTGHAFDWTTLADLPDARIVVAGGLNPGNVGDLLARYRPWAVDTSSGVESAPGIKDPARLAAFLDAVRTT